MEFKIMVKVSIGIPVYNVSEYLRQCLDSVLIQTFTDFEVILVDDGSTDDSFRICQEYVSRDKRFKLIHQENKGLAGARNTCLRYMTGDFIAWLDSDDWLEDDRSEERRVGKESKWQECRYAYKERKNK